MCCGWVLEVNDDLESHMKYKRNLWVFGSMSSQAVRSAGRTRNKCGAENPRQ